MTDIDWPPLIDLAEKVSHEVAGKWSVVESEDVKQEILLYAMERKDYIADLQDDTEILRKIFWVAGRRYASKERDHYDLMDDQYFYTPGEVRVALRSFLYTDEELGEILGKEDDLLRCRVDDNLVSARLDAKICMRKLNDRYQRLIQQVFVCGIPVEPGSPDERASYRAVDALTQAMNRYIRSSSSRKVEKDAA